MTLPSSQDLGPCKFVTKPIHYSMWPSLQFHCKLYHEIHFPQISVAVYYLKTHCLLQVQGIYHHHQQQNNINLFLNQPLEIQFAEYVHVLKCYVQVGGWIM